MKFILPVPYNFNFWRTVYSHGWCSLPPFRVVKDEFCLRMALNASPHKAVAIGVTQPSRGRLEIEASSRDGLSSREKGNIIPQVKASLRLDEDFGGFHREARKQGAFRWVARMRAGRLLRAPTVFEDVIKMICTTNCTWALTEVMVGNLCTKLGKSLGEGEYAFPQPEAIANVTEKFLRKEIRAGYRAPYLLEVSRRIIKGDLEIESWRQSTMPTEELYKLVRSVKGVGPYAAGNILKLLGRYDYLAIDSWCRKKFSELHKNGRKTSDVVIERFYQALGKWKGLFFWLDITKDWYEREFPF